MVDNQHWLDRWHQNRIGFHEDSVNGYLKRHFSRFQLDPGACVFIPLCGKAHDIKWIADHGHEVIGIELSQLAIEAFFEENALAYERIETDRVQVANCSGQRGGG